MAYKQLDFDKLKEPTTAEDFPDDDEDIEISFEDDEEDGAEKRKRPDAEDSSDEDEDSESPENEEDEDSDSDDEEDVSEYEAVDPDYKKYGKRAQKRIQALVARAKEAEERERQYQERLQQLENEGREWQTQATQSRMQNAKNLLRSLEQRRASLRENYERAFEEGNSKRIAEIQDELQEVAVQRTGLKNWIDHQESQSGPDRRETRGEERRSVQQQPAQQPAQQQPQQRELDVHQRRWLKKNRDWWDKDRTTTRVALAIHQDLITEGYRPGDEDDSEFGAPGYYKELDNRLRQELPHKFQDASAGNRGGKQTVSGPTRSPKKTNSNKVTLSKSERELAKRLGISEKAYAREKLKKMRSTDNG